MEAWKVKLKQPSSAGIGNQGQTLIDLQVVFDASPDLSESGSVTYKTVDPVHSPGGILVFASSSARTFQLSNIKLFSRTREEATRNFHRLQILRSWRYPSFGRGGTDPAYGDIQLGAPPAVLELSAYARPNGNNESGMATGLIHRIPVVISQLGIDYPSDCDYIPTIAGDPAIFGSTEFLHIPNGIPMPTILPISIQLMEAHAPSQYSNFSLADFRRGRLEGF